MARQNKKALKKKKAMETEQNFIKYAILGTVILLIIIFLVSYKNF